MWGCLVLGTLASGAANALRHPVPARELAPLRSSLLALLPRPAPVAGLARAHPRAWPAMLAKGKVGRPSDLEKGGPDLPLGWSVQQDPASGTDYYVNEATGESQWEAPTEFISGWSVQQDPASGAFYYVNDETGASQWEFPKALASEAAQAAPVVKAEPVPEVPRAAPAVPPLAPMLNFDAPEGGSPGKTLRGAPAGLAADVERFRMENQANGQEEGEPTLVQKVINFLGTVLTYNFFIICSFFAWFLTGIVAEYGFQSSALLTAFRGAWDFLIQPLLTTHMTLTFLSAGLERLPAGEQQET